MRFSFVFTDGRINLDGEPRIADHRLYHLELPRAVGLMVTVPGTVEGKTVRLPTIDVLAAIRALHGGSDSWLGSGARAQLTGASIHPHSLQKGRAFIRHLGRLLDNAELARDVDPPVELDGRRKLRWKATATGPDGKQVTKRFEELGQAEDWLRRRAFARAIGWPFSRTDQLLDDPDVNPTLDELLDLAEHLGEPPSELLATTHDL